MIDRRPLAAPTCVLLCAWLVSCSTTFAADPATDAAALENAAVFARDVRPIFAKHCVTCHGPDMSEGSLRLDVRADAERGGVSGPAWVAGKSGESRLIAYVTGKNEDNIRMPPEGEPLAEEDIAKLRAWIDAGAIWSDEGPGSEAAKAAHWSFQPLAEVAPPAVESSWVKNGIDHFVVARLKEAGFEPSPEADRYTLIRRLSLDLLGLPPTPEQIAEFVNDARPDAYEQLVERLLASPHYGERWGRHWLDLARYADSDGYEKDTPRPHAWRYRNWVIDALNRDLPFNEFTIEQLAGDLLPDATNEQLVATGFHRNTLLNREGGVDQEEFRVAATVDRVATTGSVWLGLTVGCAQCHTHKYDPISHREFYGFFAFFNSLDDVDIGAPLAEELVAYEKARMEHDAKTAKLETALAEYDKNELPAKQSAWEASVNPATATRWATLVPSAATATEEATLAVKDDGSILAEGKNPERTTYRIEAPIAEGSLSAVRIEALPVEGHEAKGPGRAKHGNFVLSDLKVEIIPPAAVVAAAQTTTEGAAAATAANATKAPAPQAVALKNAQADFSQENWAVEGAVDSDAKTGWAISPKFGQRHVAVFQCSEPVAVPAGSKLAIVLDQQYGTAHTLGRFRVSTTGSSAIEIEGLPTDVAAALERPATGRADADRERIAAHYRGIDEGRVAQVAVLDKHRADAPKHPSETTKAQAFQERKEKRETHILARGDFLQPGEVVEAHTLGVLPPLVARGEKADRLDLARWLIDPANPLTPRVTVNRIWQAYFGRGLVPTSNDFGTQGEKPSHPELLDWVAREFMSRGWSLKNLHRLIVTSATYRQSSRQRSELVEADPYNQLLGRQRRLRVEAEVVRDLALASSGLLNAAIGGQSVRPVQPDGIADLGYAGSVKWQTSEGADRYRRGLYTFFQRTVPYPMLMTFDAPDSNVTCTRRERSNTPLQALTLLNDPVFVECSQGLGRRIVADVPATGDAAQDLTSRAQHLFLLCLSRPPSESELVVVGDLYAAQRELMAASAEMATEIVSAKGKEASAEPAAPDAATTAEIAAWTIVGRTLLNLDEFITRE